MASRLHNLEGISGFGTVCPIRMDFVFSTNMFNFWWLEFWLYVLKKKLAEFKNEVNWTILIFWKKKVFKNEYV